MCSSLLTQAVYLDYLSLVVFKSLPSSVLKKEHCLLLECVIKGIVGTNKAFQNVCFLIGNIKLKSYINWIDKFLTYSRKDRLVICYSLTMLICTIPPPSQWIQILWSIFIIKFHKIKQVLLLNSELIVRFFLNIKREFKMRGDNEAKSVMKWVDTSVWCNVTTRHRLESESCWQNSYNY